VGCDYKKLLGILLFCLQALDNCAVCMDVCVTKLAKDFVTEICYNFRPVIVSKYTFHSHHAFLLLFIQKIYNFILSVATFHKQLHGILISPVSWTFKFIKYFSISLLYKSAHAA
jgi:hypothetical protein